MRLLPTVAFLIVVSTVVEASSRPRRKPPSKTRPEELNDGDGWPSVKLGEVSPCKTRTPPGKTASPLTETAYENVVDYVTTVVKVEVVTKTVTTDVWVTVYPEKLSAQLPATAKTGPIGGGRPRPRPRPRPTEGLQVDPLSQGAPSSEALTTQKLESNGYPSVSLPPPRPPKSAALPGESEELQPQEHVSPPPAVPPIPPEGPVVPVEPVSSSDGGTSSTFSDVAVSDTAKQLPALPTNMPGDLPNPEETILATTASQVIPIQPSAPSADASAEVSNTTSTAAPASPAPPGPPAQPPSPPVGVQPAGKKGLNYNNPALLSQFAGAGQVGWVANWEQTIEGVPPNMHYYPTLWNTEQQRVDRWTATCEAAMTRGDKVLFGFNEPQSDQCARQACMTAEAAAAAWRQYMVPWKAKGAVLVSPSISQGPVGEQWLTDFIAKCPPADCKIDAISLHWYEGAHQIEYFKKYFIDAHNNAAYGNLPIYVTEFAPTSGTPEEKAAFIREAVAWMNKQDFILGYALFWAEDATTNGVINAIGAAYAQAI